MSVEFEAVSKRGDKERPLSEHELASHHGGRFGSPQRPLSESRLDLGG